MATYKIHKNSLTESFMKSRKKIQVYAGGFANGKTAASCIKAIEICRDYPGCNILIARSTYPKLNDTIRKEFEKWCPTDWIKSFPKSANGSNTCTLTNGSTINFRYVKQQGRVGNESTTSNLLSATYDFIVVDQMEDPEISHKDLLDLLGRLRGSTPYKGTDRTMPATGPRFMVITFNPTRNWVYKEVIKPIHDLQKGIYNDKLFCERDINGRVILNDNNLPTPIIDLFEGSTYTNKENLEADYITTLESTYQGQQRDRFLMGEWAAYEGLIYSEFLDEVHVMDEDRLFNYLSSIRHMTGRGLEFIEGYDYGMAVPSCYLAGYTDHLGNVFIMDGFYEAELSLDEQFSKIKEIRATLGIDNNNFIFSDPSIFRRSLGDKKLVGKSIASMFLDEGLICTRGNNDIVNGITKVKSYLTQQAMHANPITLNYDSPYLYFNRELNFIFDEINDYYWRKNADGDREDVPTDKNDHALDTLKYMLSHRPDISVLLSSYVPKLVGLYHWAEVDSKEQERSIRHG